MTEIGELSEELQKHKRNGNKLPFVVCTTIEEKVIAKSHRSSITSMYAGRDRSNVIGFYGDHCLLTMITDEYTITEINKALSDTNNQAKLISSIIDISPFYPEVDEYDGDMPFYKIRLLNYNNFDLNRAVYIQHRKNDSDWSYIRCLILGTNCGSKITSCRNSLSNRWCS